jgi:hypothetical protein
MLQPDPENGKEMTRFHLNRLDKVDDPHWALFFRDGTRKNGKVAYFHCLIASKEEALEVARDYALKQFGRGKTNFSYYVVEVKHHLGFKDGKFIDLAL